MLKEKVLKALEKVRPSLQMDGGDIELISINEKTKVVTVRLQGSCSGCPMSAMTLKHSVEKTIKEEVPEVTAVEAI
ncbi:MAG: NifU family protein [bacterium]|nr:NifU family protein [bacterium]